MRFVSENKYGEAKNLLTYHLHFTFVKRTVTIPNMLGWFKRRPNNTYQLSPGNPGEHVAMDVAFHSERRQWTEKIDVVKLSRRILSQHGHHFSKQDDWLIDSKSGLVLAPRLASFQPLDDGRGSTSMTTIEVIHPEKFPDGVFEYQHSVGESLEESISKGIDQWAQVDLVTLLDSLRDEPENCTTMVMEFPETDSRPAYTRRAILGPIAHYTEDPPPEIADEDDHPFCPCCFLTRSHEAFEDQIQSQDYLAIRCFAARDTEGATQADCRINGEDYDQGMDALRQYVATWPGSGYEFRKQYVVLQTVS